MTMQNSEDTGLPDENKELYHDLDFLAGSWTEQEADQFDEALAAQRSLETCPINTL